MAEAASTDLEGLDGWLTLVILGLIGSPIQIVVSFATKFWPLFRNGAWNALTTPGSPIYHSMWAPLLIFEIAGNVVLIVLPIVTLVLLFKRSRKTPRWAIAWFALWVCFAVADYCLGNLVPAVAAAQSGRYGVAGIVYTSVAAVIWIPYFLVSKQVKATFIR